ncbi:MAG: cytochrome c biogenesis protein CcdA [Candidatus Binatia bacterium]
MPPAHRLIVALIFTVSTASVVAASERVTVRLQLDSEEAVRGGQTGLEILPEIEPGWHINAHKPIESYLIPTEVSLSLPSGVSADTLNYPRPDRKAFTFAQGKELLVYEGRLGISTALNVPADFEGTRLRIGAMLRYQACNDVTCLPPATASAKLIVPVSATVVAPQAAPAAKRVPEQGEAVFDAGSWLTRHGLGTTLLLVALLGLGLNLTPCVYPLISVTVAYFGAQGRRREAHVAALAAIYVLGIALSFSVAGVTAALSGGLFGAVLQKPPVLLFIAAALVVLALSSFGLYHLQPPAWALRRVSGSVHGAFGSFFMGLTMGVVAAPCVGPVVLGLLLFVGSRQDGLLGFELFAALGLGMGLPYLGLAMAAGSIKALPRSGQWLVWVERVFGVVLLGLAAYLVEPLLPKVVSRLLLPGLAAAGGIYLGFIDQSGFSMPYFIWFKRLGGVAAVVIAAWAVMPPWAESRIAWRPFEVASLEGARNNGRPAVVDFLADWCVPCREMEHTTFRDPHVRQQAERFAMFKADITRDSEDADEIVGRYRIRGVPTVLVFDSSGLEVQRLIGYIGPEEMAKAMHGVQ